jgi:hypothetical protein
VEVSPAAEAPVPDVDTSRPHSARMYDYFLGSNFDLEHTVARHSPPVARGYRSRVRRSCFLEPLFYICKPTPALTLR